uniref:Putative secreted metalloprotease n=1 Tax=Ixodes ricinus TaxID=34613 RepID=A0A6B0UFF8_IXORI
MSYRCTILRQRTCARLIVLISLTIHIVQKIILGGVLLRSASFHVARRLTFTDQPTVHYPMARIAQTKMAKMTERCAYLKYALRYKSTWVKCKKKKENG